MILDQPLEHRVDVALMPQVPGVGRSPRSDVNALRRLVEADLVLPLLVVHLRRGATAAMHRNPQAAAVRRGLAESLLEPAQGLVADLQRLFLHLLLPLHRNQSGAIRRKQSRHPGRHFLGQGRLQRGCVRLALRRRQRQPGLDRRQFRRHRDRRVPGGIHRRLAFLHRREDHLA